MRQAAFGGRLKYFRKLGVRQHHLGKGSRVRYAAPDAFQLIIAYGFAKFGADPSQSLTSYRVI